MPRKYLDGMPQFPYWMAAYPKTFSAYLVSPQKICLQFETAQLKTRAPTSKEGLTSTPKGTYEMPICTQGTDIAGLAVGVPLALYPVLIENILKAISEHHIRFPEHSINDHINSILRSHLLCPQK